MTADEAYKKILVRYPFQTVQTCLEIDDFYVFFMRPLGLSKKERCLTGTIFPAVKKKNGEFLCMILLLMLMPISKQKKIDIKIFLI